jgi:PleD family two-component response regulator
MLLQNYRLIMRMIDEQEWVLRNVIIWHKPNHMPSSVRDRFANAYDSVFMMIKNTEVQFYYNEIPLKITISAGIAGVPSHALGAEELVRKADQAMYKSKQA